MRDGHLMSDRCLTRLRAVEHPALRLFLFHCAGGSHLLFRGWEEWFPHDWELCTLEAPGRGRLGDRPLARNADEIAAIVLPAMAPMLKTPFALFGHSMGGLLAYDLTLRLAQADLPQPVWLGVSGRRAPAQDRKGAMRLEWDLPAGELQRGVVAMGGTPDSVIADPSMWAILEPILRADLRLADTWQPPSVPPFTPPPLSIFAGSSDAFVPPEHLQRWREHSSRFLGFHYFPGGHFYFQQRLPELAKQIMADVAAALQACRPA